MDKKLKAQRDAERSKNAVKNGFCYRCIKNPIDFTVSKRYCSVCFAKKSQADKEYREKNKEHLKEYFKTLDKTPERKAKSKIYRDKRAEKESLYHKEMYEFRKLNNLCVRCGKTPPIYGLLYCQSCKEKFQRHYPSYKAKLLSSGLCLSCKQPNGNGKSMCDKCTQEGTARFQAWKIANPDKVKLGNAKYSRENKEKEREKTRRWAKNNPVRVRELKKKRHYIRRALKKEFAGNYSAKEWAEILEKYGNKCLCCEETSVELTVDHVIPLSKGGSSNPDNLQPLCRSCNSRKRNKILDFRPFGRAILDWT